MDRPYLGIEGAIPEHGAGGVLQVLPGLDRHALGRDKGNSGYGEAV